MFVPSNVVIAAEAVSVFFRAFCSGVYPASRARSRQQGLHGHEKRGDMLEKWVQLSKPSSAHGQTFHRSIENHLCVTGLASKPTILWAYLSAADSVRINRPEDTLRV
jgi:hypothetical protein